MDNIRYGDTGIRVTVTHTATCTVYASINGRPGVALTGNSYVSLTSAETTMKVGTNKITFYIEDGNLITSPEVYEFNIY